MKINKCNSQIFGPRSLRRSDVLLSKVLLTKSYSFPGHTIPSHRLGAPLAFPVALKPLLVGCCPLPAFCSTATPSSAGSKHRLDRCSPTTQTNPTVFYGRKRKYGLTALEYHGPGQMLLLLTVGKANTKCKFQHPHLFALSLPLPSGRYWATMVTDWPARFRAAAACSCVAFLRLTPFTCPKRGAVSHPRGKKEFSF